MQKNTVNTMNKQKVGKWTLMAVLLIVIASVLFTSNLTRQLAQEEQKNVAIWAEATRRLILAKEGEDIGLYTSIIEQNTTIPVYIVDMDGNVLTSRNVENPVEDPRKLNGPITIRIARNNIQYIYYDESKLLRLLRAVPYVQFLLICLFVGVAVWMLLTAQRAEKDHLWAGLSKETAHQLGTPISSLIAWEELLVDRYPSDELIPQMKADIDRLSTIADRFSKIGSEPELQCGDIARTVEKAVGYMQSRVSKKVEIQTEIAAVNRTVEENEALIEWVIENLVKNAVDAMGGEGKIRIKIGEEGENVIVDISDTGKGMDKATARRVFEPGFTTKKRGWGLGLTLAKRIVEEYHGGRLLLKHTKVGEGSEFRLSIKKAEDRRATA